MMHDIERVLQRRANTEAEAMRREFRLVGRSRAGAECPGVLLIVDVAREQHPDRAIVRMHEIDVPLRVLAFRQAAGDDPRRARHLDQILGVGQSADECQAGGGVARRVRGNLS
jgi:hypothetical protein